MVDKRPNILLIMTDDHAAHAISAYGSKINTTPNIDRIAHEGVRYDNCFCTNSICEPSRATILTGTYNHVNGVTTIGANIDNRQENLAKILQANHYQTGIIGKWHLGEGPAHCPTGFDEYKVLQNQGPYFDPELVCNGKKVKYQGYTTDIITDLSVEYIKKRDKHRPFMLMCYHKAPHRNWEPDEKHQDMFRDIELPHPYSFNDDHSGHTQAAREAMMRVSDHLSYHDLKLIPPEGVRNHCFIPHPDNVEGFFLVPRETGEKVYFKDRADLKNFKYQRYLKDYLRCVAAVDDGIGVLFNTLEEEGILDDTIIVYTSDQGFFLGDHNWYDKRFMYEESLRMPFIMRYPREIPAGIVQQEIITNVDFAQTFLDYAGIPASERMQGYSIRALNRGEVPEGWQQSMYYRYWMHLSHHNVAAHYGIRTKEYKLIYYYGEALGQPGALNERKDPEWELFDLKKDPYEMQNVYPRPEYREIVTKLKAELHALQAKTGDTPVKEIG